MRSIKSQAKPEYAENIHTKNTHGKYMRSIKSRADTESHHENVWNIQQCLLVKGKSPMSMQKMYTPKIHTPNICAQEKVTQILSHNMKMCEIFNNV